MLRVSFLSAIFPHQSDNGGQINRPKKTNAKRQNIVHTPKVANPITINTFPPGLLASIALIIFGALGDNRDFMPDWENNYLSWSFGLAFVGAVAGKIFLSLF